MSFGTYARKVRDPALVQKRRFDALVECIGRYQPLGYYATYAYLRHVAGNFRRDEAALIRAIDMLDASRELWLAEMESYAARRKSAKRHGVRKATKAEVQDDPSSPDRWYGDERNAATYALNYTLAGLYVEREAPRTEAHEEVLTLASACLAQGGALTPADRARLATLDARFGDHRDSRRMLHLIRLVSGEP